MKRQETVFQKLICVVTAAVFTFTSSAWGLSPAVQLGTIPPAGEVYLSQLHLAVPQELATVEAHYNSRSENRPFIVHIQNAHASAGAQFQIETLLRFLSEKRGIKTALVEGAVNELDPELLRFFADTELNRSVNEYLVREGIISGVQLFQLSANKSVRVFGVEDAGLYRENLAAFRNVMQSESTIQRFVGQAKAIITKLEQKIFDDDLRDYAAKQNAYRDRSLGLLPYVEYLRTEARLVLDLDLGNPNAQHAWPALTRLFVMRNLREIDRASFDEEFTRLEARLERSGLSIGIREKLRALKKHSEKKDRTPLSSGGPRALIEEMFLAGGEDIFPAREYPEVSNWLAHEILGSELDGARLMAEISRLSDMLRDKLVDTPDEEALIALSDDVDLIVRALALELTGEEFDRFLAREDNLQLTPLASRLMDFQSRAGVPDTAMREISFSAEKIDGLLAAAKQFYVHARLRDDAMVENIDRLMTEYNLGTAVLITGGFHTKGILERFRERDYSYLTLTPQLSGKTDFDRTHYISGLMDTRTNIFARAHLEQLLANQANVLDAWQRMSDRFDTTFPSASGVVGTGIFRYFMDSKTPARRLSAFLKNEMLPMGIRLDDPEKPRYVFANLYGREAKISVGFGGVLDERSLDDAVVRLTDAERARRAAETDAEKRTAAERGAQARAEARKAEEARRAQLEFASQLEQLAREDTLQRIDAAEPELLINLSDALKRVNEIEEARALTNAEALRPLLKNLSRAVFGTIPLASLLDQVDAPALLAIVRKSNLSGRVTQFLSPAEAVTAEGFGVPSPERSEPDVASLLNDVLFEKGHAASITPNQLGALRSAILANDLEAFRQTLEVIRPAIEPNLPPGIRFDEWLKDITGVPGSESRLARNISAEISARGLPASRRTDLTVAGTIIPVAPIPEAPPALSGAPAGFGRSFGNVDERDRPPLAQTQQGLVKTAQTILDHLRAQYEATEVTQIAAALQRQVQFTKNQETVIRSVLGQAGLVEFIEPVRAEDIFAPLVTAIFSFANDEPLAAQLPAQVFTELFSEIIGAFEIVTAQQFPFDRNARTAIELLRPGTNDVFALIEIQMEEVTKGPDVLATAPVVRVPYVHLYKVTHRGLRMSAGRPYRAILELASQLDTSLIHPDELRGSNTHIITIGTSDLQNDLTAVVGESGFSKSVMRDIAQITLELVSGGKAIEITNVPKFARIEVRQVPVGFGVVEGQTEMKRVRVPQTLELPRAVQAERLAPRPAEKRTPPVVGAVQPGRIDEARSGRLQITQEVAKVVPPRAPRTPAAPVVPPRPEQIPQLTDIKQFTNAQLSDFIFEEFKRRFPTYEITAEKALRILDLVTLSIAHRIYGNPFLRELRSRRPVEFEFGGEGVPVTIEVREPVTEKLSITAGLPDVVLTKLARSGGMIVGLDLTAAGAPSGKALDDQIESFLKQLKDDAISQYKIAILAKVAHVDKADFRRRVKNIASRLGVHPGRFQVVPVTDRTEFADKLATLHNRLASYVTEEQRMQHVSILIPQSLEEEIAKIIHDDGVTVIVHDIKPGTEHAKGFYYWAATIAMLHALLKDELSNPSVQAIFGPTQPGSRPGFIHFVTALAVELKADLERVERILTSV